MTSETGRFVRPYAITRGRTASGGDEIPLEAQVTATVDPNVGAAKYRWEAKQVLEICLQPTALIEIAARLEVPIGVARVIVGDLARENVLVVGSELPEDEIEEVTYSELLERVLDGIKNL